MWPKRWPSKQWANGPLTVPLLILHGPHEVVSMSRPIPCTSRQYLRDRHRHDLCDTRTRFANAIFRHASYDNTIIDLRAFETHNQDYSAVSGGGQMLKGSLLPILSLSPFLGLASLSSLP